MTEQEIFLIVSGIVLVVALIIHKLIVDGDLDLDMLDMFFIDDGGWITVLVVVLLAAIVYGFIFWIWWAMLLIVLGVSTLGVVGLIVLVHFIRKEEESSDESDDEDDNEEIATGYHCQGCGASLFKRFCEDDEGNMRPVYCCDFCGAQYTKKDLENKMTDSDTNVEEVDLDDWEEEYFDACYYLRFKPYCEHSERQLQRRYDQLNEEYDSADIDDDQWEKIEAANEFFKDEENEIGQYLQSNDEETIKKHYQYYLSLIEDEDDE